MVKLLDACGVPAKYGPKTLADVKNAFFKVIRLNKYFGDDLPSLRQE